VSEVSTLFLLESRFGSLLGPDADVFWLRRCFTHWFDSLSTLHLVPDHLCYSSDSPRLHTPKSLSLRLASYQPREYPGWNI
jgi:hypothetical protein